jgi:type I restriction enzyme S subunit
VRSQEPLAINEFEFDEQAVVTAGDGVGVGRVFHFVNGKYALHQRAYRVSSLSPQLDTKFLYHLFRADFARYLKMTSVHASVTSLRRPMFEKYPIPLIPLEKQREIVTILDKLNTLTNALCIALPAELDARRKQYDYYRNHLLTFQEAAV